MPPWLQVDHPKASQKAIELPSSNVEAVTEPTPRTKRIEACQNSPNSPCSIPITDSALLMSGAATLIMGAPCESVHTNWAVPPASVELNHSVICPVAMSHSTFRQQQGYRERTSHCCRE
jgi:hypothetical protein